MLVDGTNSKAVVTGAIRRAAETTGASFDYLLATAKVESNLNPGSRAATSSAKGLFQFIEQTWLAMLKEAGSALGLGRYSESITQTRSGGYTVTDASTRAEILNLRADPAASAALAGAFTQRNAAELTQRLGRPPVEGELYIAHFLGSGGAARLIKLAANSPAASAADSFPSAAAANRSIFYDRQGRARSAAEVYGALVGRYQIARGAPSPSAPKSFENTAGVTLAFATANPPAAASDPPAFHGLFREPIQRRAVAPVVSALWGAPKSTQASVARPVGHSFENLFRDHKPNVRGLFEGKA